MKLEYDKEAEAVYIELMDIPDGGVAHTEELVPDTVMVDRTKSGEICGIEILGIDSIVEFPKPWWHRILRYVGAIPTKSSRSRE